MLSLIGGKSTAARLLSLGSALLGEPDEDGKWPPESLEGMLKKLEEASQKAEPLDKIATHLRDAKETAAEWQDINTEQKMREAVAEELEPLKDLKNLVDAETRCSIQSLSKPRRRSP